MPPSREGDDAADKAAIRRLLIGYTWALDDRDWAALRSCFEEDGVADYGPGFGRYDGAEAIVETCRNALTGFDATQHFLSNVEVEIDGDAATARSYVHAQHYLKDVGCSVVGATYVDQIRRGDGGWAIATRRMDVSWRSGETRIFELASSRAART